MKRPSDVVFSDAVKAAQKAMGSRAAYAKMSEQGDWADTVTPELEQFIAQQDSLFLATASADGQPYIQHRGGPAGFLKTLDAHTLAFADFSGNRQYISVGNLSENSKVQLFLIDYAHQQRVKIWGNMQISEDQDLIDRLMPSNYRARAERALVLTVSAWDANCPKHIPHLMDAMAVREALTASQERITALERELEALRAHTNS